MGNKRPATDGTATFQNRDKISDHGGSEAERLQKTEKDIFPILLRCEFLTLDNRKAIILKPRNLRRDRTDIFIRHRLNLSEPLHILVQGSQKRRIQPLKKREHLVTDAVALVGGISVGAVLVPLQTVRDSIFMNILPRKTKQRPDEPSIRTRQKRTTAHSGHSFHPRAAQHIQYHRLRIVVGIVSDSQSGNSSLPTDLREPSVTQLPRRHLDAHAIRSGIFLGVKIFLYEYHAVAFGPCPDKSLVRVTLLSPQVEIAVSQRETPPDRGIEKQLRHTHRVNPAADSQKNRLSIRKQPFQDSVKTFLHIQEFYFLLANVYVKPNWRACANCTLLPTLPSLSVTRTVSS